MLMIMDDESAVAAASPAEIEAILERHAELSSALRAAGAWIGSHRLRPSSQAARVRRRGGKLFVLDGPFAESKQALGGLYIIEAASMEQALEWAKKVPVVEGSTVEVRAVWGTTESGRWRES